MSVSLQVLQRLGQLNVPAFQRVTIDPQLRDVSNQPLNVQEVVVSGGFNWVSPETPEPTFDVQNITGEDRVLLWGAKAVHSIQLATNQPLQTDVGPGGQQPSSAPSIPFVATDLQIEGQAEGDILFRSATAWQSLPAGAPGQLLETQPTGPQWVNAPSAGGSTSAVFSVASGNELYTPAGVLTGTLGYSGVGDLVTNGDVSAGAGGDAGKIIVQTAGAYDFWCRQSQNPSDVFLSTFELRDDNLVSYGSSGDKANNAALPFGDTLWATITFLAAAIGTPAARLGLYGIKAAGTTNARNAQIFVVKRG